MLNRQHFTKMQSNGNDFVIIDVGDKQAVSLQPSVIKQMADRQRGIGFDQLLILTHTQSEHYTFLIWNADGSMASQCINGLRCLGQYILARNPQNNVTISNGHDVFQLSIHDQAICITLKQDTTRYTVTPGVLTMNDDSIAIEWVQFTNAHVIMPVSDLQQVQFDIILSAIHATKRCPDGINVTCYTEKSDGILESLTFERGTGKTQACGSAACALALSYYKKNNCEDPILIRQPGGDQTIHFIDNTIQISGPAVEVFSGSIQLPLVI